MGLFDDQIEKRKQYDQEMIEQALGDIQATIMEVKHPPHGFGTAEDAVNEIFEWFDIKPAVPPALMTDFDQRLACMMAPTGILLRKVILSGAWYRNADMPLLAFFQDGRTVALIPEEDGSYSYVDHQEGMRYKAGEDTLKKLCPEALYFYKPLPLRRINTIDLIQYILRCLKWSDYVWLFSTSVMIGLLGMVTPLIVRYIMGEIIPQRDSEGLGLVAVILVSVIIAKGMMQLCNNFSFHRIRQKISVYSYTSIMARVLSLPADFFREHNAGEMQTRIRAVQNSIEIIRDVSYTVLSGFVFMFFSLIQISQIAPGLFMLTLAIVIAQMLVLILAIHYHSINLRDQYRDDAEMTGLVYRLFSGIQKIKLAGAEKRAFSKWAHSYSKYISHIYQLLFFHRLEPAITVIISMGGLMLLYYNSAIMEMSVGDFTAYLVDYGIITGALGALGGIADQLGALRPLIGSAKPILDAVPEINDGKKTLTRMSGGLELSNLSFRYGEGDEWVLDRLNLRIRAGQYVAVVGRTGSGKSTLVRLLLGFEKPDMGAVYYDNHDLQLIDPRSLRRQIGVVMQNTKLFAGDIYSNIAMSCPGLSLEDAWKAAEMAGIADEIRRMPMGMRTVISEGGMGLSGGQRQRIIIAAAIAAKPKILIMDEATSALDNVTQRQVSESLDKLKCTRIVIAHRLSTIRTCHRILVLDQGRIAEDGTYDELMAKGGLFTELVRRQTIDIQGA